MSYLDDFTNKLRQRDFSGFMLLWEEYCASDAVDAKELIEILKLVKNSESAKSFGPYAEATLHLWEKIQDPLASFEVLKLIIDLQTINSHLLYEIALSALKSRYGQHKHFHEKLRLVGMRAKDHFQGAISNYELLTHLEKGNFVYHTAGWGVGEVMDVSLTREQVLLEFESFSGKKELSFSNAFKNLIPLPKDHFLARRFGNPDELEKEAKANPVRVMHLLLKDLGPKTASEIKDELCGLVIPEEEWSKWWQNTRAKLKKDTLIESPESLKAPFVLRGEALAHDTKLLQTIEKMPLDTEQDIAIFSEEIYRFLRSFPEHAKKESLIAPLKDRLFNLRKNKNLTPEQNLEVHFLIEDLFQKDPEFCPVEFLKKALDPLAIIKKISIVTFQKRSLASLQKARSDYKELFMKLLLSAEAKGSWDHILKEMSTKETLPILEETFKHLRECPTLYPEAFIWVFQKLLARNDLPMANEEGRRDYLESMLVLLHFLEDKPEMRDLVKKIYQILSGDRFQVVRTLLAGSNIAYAKEFLLLASKCRSLEDHDVKILQSLAAVVHPTLAKAKEKVEFDEDIIWTTQEGYQKIQQRIKQIGTIEVVDNAKEIEEARAHGDLRENAEFKAAQERRARLQGELKQLTQQLNKARILSPDDISKDEVSPGAVVGLKNPRGEEVSYTLLGPWDANPDANILSFQSRLAQAMMGCKIGQKFRYQDEEFTVVKIGSYLEQ